MLLLIASVIITITVLTKKKVNADEITTKYKCASNSSHTVKISSNYYELSSSSHAKEVTCQECSYTSYVETEKHDTASTGHYPNSCMDPYIRCTKCGYKIEEVSDSAKEELHDFIQLANYYVSISDEQHEEQYTCKTCNTIVKKNRGNHNSDTAPSSCVYPYYLCSACGKKMRAATDKEMESLHDYVNGVCKMCKKKEDTTCANAHSYTQYEQYNFSASSGGVGYHLLVCSECGCKTSESCYKSKTEVATKPTCTTSGRWKYTCNKCEAYWYATIPALGHSYDDNGKCTRCSAVEDTTCEHGYYKVHYDYTDDDTCTKTKTCQYCGEVFTETFSHTGGTHDNGGTCTNCKGQYQNHKRTTGTFIRWDSNETSHRTVLECYGCKESGDDGEYYTDWSDHFGGTHDNGGTCQACGTKYQEHNETDYYELISSTLHRKILECSCGETTITNETSSHTYYANFKYAKDNGDGTHSLQCKDCLGYAKKEEHQYSEATCTTKPTCTVKGCKAQLDVEVSHVGATHENGGKCTKCETVYQTHSQSARVKEYTKTSTGHTPIYACSYSGCTGTYNGTVENHTGATHANGGKCTVCGYVYQTHGKGTTVKEYTKTATGHTPVYACSYSGCTETYTGTAEKHNITTYADTGDGTHKGTCKDCSYEVVNAHTYSDGKCTVCNATEPKKDEQCEHTYVIKSDDNSHWEECSKCNNIKESTKSAHTISSWTDKQDGTHQGKCTVCQKVVIETHTNGTSGKCTKCSYDGTNSNNNNNNDNNNSNDNNNNDNNNGDNNGNNNNGNNNSNNSNNSNNNNGSNNSGTNSGTTNKDNTTANGSIPQTGSSPILILTLVMLVSIVGFTVFKMNKIKDIK